MIYWHCLFIRKVEWRMLFQWRKISWECSQHENVLTSGVRLTVCVNCEFRSNENVLKFILNRRNKSMKIVLNGVFFSSNVYILCFTFLHLHEIQCDMWVELCTLVSIVKVFAIKLACGAAYVYLSMMTWGEINSRDFIAYRLELLKVAQKKQFLPCLSAGAFNAME